MCVCDSFVLCEYSLPSDLLKQHSLFAHIFHLERNEHRVKETFWLRASVGMWKASRIRLVEG